MAFQDNLRKYRELAGYSQAKDFADILGIKYTTYTAYENQGREPKFELLVKIAKFLGVTTDDLLGVVQEDEFFSTKKWLEKSGYKIKTEGKCLDNPEIFIAISKLSDYPNISYLVEKKHLAVLVSGIIEQSNQVRDTLIIDKINFFFKNIPRGKEIVSDLNRIHNTQ